MARTNNDDMLMEDELAAAFLDEPESTPLADSTDKSSLEQEPSDGDNDGWDNTDEFPGQLAVDVYER